MNADEIHALSDRELDAVVAEQAMGFRVEWRPDGTAQNRKTPCIYSPTQRPCGSNDIRIWQECPHFHNSLDACHAAEERLKDMGLATAFTVQLYLVAVEAQKADGRRHPIRWYEVHATARERAEAILMAMQEVMS